MGERPFKYKKEYSVDDKQIIELFFERNENAIRQTEIKYGRLCRGIASNILNDAGDAEECVNDTYLAVWNKIPPERPSNFTAFICKIARNLSLKRLEYNSAAKRNSSRNISLSELEAAIPDESISNVEDTELGKMISEFLKNEKETARNVFIRRYYFHDGISELAEAFGFGEAKVKSMLFHTRSRLKKFLTERGVCL